ncbi:IS4 family transposase [Methylosinus trichosporium]|uniref:IS4 family transposase n=1 Tax=Methylosinus trichosporium (strain ATCC 35070 / NCIMB 11131 / UNIQEM 75 / OB3b) TaxID=595536 RepID=A0A2D2D3Q0_METT3|nr:IS4 family transposase [Methylosinus trichosporium]ATQ69628.1 IS4 family transposase [Methylosinus trichosporium OB3b]
MRFQNSVFVDLLKPIDRRAFGQIVARHKGDAYDKSFKSWDHLVVLIAAQLGGETSLRSLEAAFNANSGSHYHLGVRRIARSTLAEANARRPVGVFADLFARLSCELDRRTRRDGAELLRLIDSTPIPLSKFHDFARSNGRIHGMKMHVVYDPGIDRPFCVEVTPANVNDVEIGKKTPIEAGATYVFDKGYYDFKWWRGIHEAGALFVSRPKSNTRLADVAEREMPQTRGEGYTVLRDCEVKLASKGDSKLRMRLRRLHIRRDALKDGKPQEIVVITNDMTRSAVEIAALYKARWAIELLFRWIKQHLNIRKFLGENENAVRLQLIAAMIAFVLLRIAAHRHDIELAHLRFSELAGRFLFERRPIDRLERPPPKYQAARRRISPRQLELAYA